MRLLGLPRLHTQAPDRMQQALDWFAAGVDLADALHLTLSQPAERFATFEDKLLRRGKKLEGVTIVAA